MYMKYQIEIFTVENGAVNMFRRAEVESTDHSAAMVRSNSAHAFYIRKCNSTTCSHESVEKLVY